MRANYNWNPVFSLVMKIKDEFLLKNPDSKINNIEYWIDNLDIKEYNDFLSWVTINQEDEFILIKYDMIECAKTSDMWTNPTSLLREARSIVIDLENEAIVECPFRKFFNVDEVEENKIDNLTEEIKHAHHVEYSNKLDCSMQNATWYNGKAILTGSQALTSETSWRVADGYTKLTDNYIQMLKDYETMTFTFENINLNDKHVVKYTPEQEGLYLIGIRDNTDGYQFAYSAIKTIADKYDVKVVQVEKTDLKTVLEKSKEYKSDEREGWVIWIDGRLVKLKCEDYIKIHKVLGKFTSPNFIVEAVYNDRLDEFLINAPDAYHEEILDIAERVKNYVESCEYLIDDAYERAPKDDKKTFMIWVDDNVAKDIKGYVRSKYLGKDYNVLQRGNSCKSAKEIGILTEEGI